MIREVLLREDLHAVVLVFVSPAITITFLDPGAVGVENPVALVAERLGLLVELLSV